MELDDDTWHLVKETPRVLGFIGGKADKPSPITEAEANAILQRVEAGVDQPRPKTVFEPGEMVRVIDGPFNDFNGVVEDVNYEKSRLNVAVLIFGRSTPVELGVWSGRESLIGWGGSFRRCLDVNGDTMWRYGELEGREAWQPTAFEPRR